MGYHFSFRLLHALRLAGYMRINPLGYGLRIYDRQGAVNSSAGTNSTQGEYWGGVAGK